MFQCHVCGGHSAREEQVTELFDVEGRQVFVEQVPALVCERCGERSFSLETGERVRRLLHGGARPVGSVTLDVFALH